MEELSKAVYVGIEGVYYSLTHVPDLVRYGSKPSREIATNSNLDERLTGRLRSHAAAVAYAPHQVFIGDLVGQELFYALLAKADQFRLVGSTWSRCGKRYWRRGRNSKSVQDVQTIQIVIGSNSSDVLNGLNDLNQVARASTFGTAL